MCGIAGIVALRDDVRVEEPALRAMADRLVHRGPDDEGFHLDPRGRAGLAFRRLSIIDLTGGRQPMSNEDGSVWVVLNGEVYNFRELRQALEARGHRFRTRCDAESVVHAYEEFGDDCIGRLEGMFAIAIWDERRGRMLLARDRLGKKPLCYAVVDHRLYFASELKAILALPDVPRRIDPQSLHRYLVFQYVPAPHCIFRGFSKLLPGSCVAFEAGRPARDEPRRYWRVPGAARFAGSYADATRRLDELLTRAVRKRLVADVPLGAFLSGGVDSSIVVGLMRRCGADPIRTFSIGFADPRYDESAYARLVARQFGTEHHEHVVTPDAREILDTLAYHYDEPFGDSSAIPTYYVSHWARQHVTVALTGDGGDECFAGYERYLALQWAGRVRGLLPAALRRAAAAASALLPRGVPRSLPGRIHRFARALPAEPGAQYLDWVAVFAPSMLRSAYAGAFAAAVDLDEPRRWFESLLSMDGAPPGSPSRTGGPAPAAQRAIHADFNSYLPYDLLTKVDIASMAVGLECRCPFLDHELVEFAASLPLDWRLGAAGGKRILKDWARGIVPRPILARAKRGFGVPLARWFRGELRGVLEERLLAPDSLSLRVMRKTCLLQLIGEHLAGRENHDHRLWALLMLELWRRRWSPTCDWGGD